VIARVVDLARPVGVDQEVYLGNLRRLRAITRALVANLHRGSHLSRPSLSRLGAAGEATVAIPLLTWQLNDPRTRRHCLSPSLAQAEMIGIDIAEA